MLLPSTLRTGLLAASLSFPLISCGGGGGGDPAPTPTDPVPTGPVVVSTAAGTAESRLACFKGVASPECNLRLYQVMVEAFADGDSTADYNTGYGTSPHKGDLVGITNALDYIKSTGVNAIWLTPIFESTRVAGQDDWASRLDATGYFASDYFKVDPKFGTPAQFQALVDAAHARGLYVFLDGVFGHYKSNLAASPTGKRPKNGNCTDVGGGSYAPGSLQACADYSDPATIAFFQEVAAHWITTYKIDGWRLDQAYQVPTASWATLRQTVATASAATTYTNAASAPVNPLGHLVAEIWSGENDIQARGYGSNAAPALQSAFDFPGRYRVVQTLAGEEALASSHKANLPATTLGEVYATYAAYPDHAMPNLMLTNHDLVRFGDLIQRAGLGNPDQDSYWRRHKAAFAFLAAHSGPVTVYYGDETGQQVPNYAAQVTSNCAVAGLCDDHVSRTAGKTTGLTTAEADLKAHVAKLLALRDTNPALAVGSRTHVYSDKTLYIDRKDAGANRVLFVLNTGTADASVTLKASVIGSPGDLTDLVDGATVTAGADGYAITVPALTGRFLKF